MDPDTSDNQTSGDGVKEILAPSEGPRENLINTAVKFLQNPKVMSSPLYQKKAFLEKKGLTQQEIELAVQRSGVAEPPPGSQQTQPVVPPGVPVPGPVVPQYAPIPPQSFWGRTRDLTMTTVVVASVSYAVYQLFQTYLRPWLMGKSEQDRRLERLEQNIKAIQSSVQESLCQISQTLAAIQASMNQQQQQSITNQGELKGISDLKADISSLKGLMLSKNQFPAAPTPTPILPSWQRAPSTAAASSSSSLLLSSSSKASTSAATETASKSEIDEKEAANDQSKMLQIEQEGEGEGQNQAAAADVDSSEVVLDSSPPDEPDEVQEPQSPALES